MPAQDNNQKQPYHQPQVKIYGDIKNLTLSVAVDGITDGADSNAVPNKTD